MSRNPQQVRWAIEDSFPIMEIGRLALRERIRPKPIYQIHKWFGRRPSSVFRALILGALKPLPADGPDSSARGGAEIILEEMYKNHSDDPDTVGTTILDPFMGGGTTVVEAIRLGCFAIGIDLNPVARFIVEAEVTPASPAHLQETFEHLASTSVPWSGRPLSETLLSLYKTVCPTCGSENADIVHMFWVRSGRCADCGKDVPLFSNYVIANRRTAVKYLQDVVCPTCSRSFDWETEPAILVPGKHLCRENLLDGAGMDRGDRRWAYSSAAQVHCPWCEASVSSRPGAQRSLPRKRVQLAALVCPRCRSVWQYRGSLPDVVSCPQCELEYNPLGDVSAKGAATCPNCRSTTTNSEAIRQLDAGELQQAAPYAIHGHCARCATATINDKADAERQRAATTRRSAHDEPAVPLARFYKRIEPPDFSLLGWAASEWERHRDALPYPTDLLPNTRETQGIRRANVRYWHQLFNSRQLLSLSSILQAICNVAPRDLRNLLLCAFSAVLESNNVLTRPPNTRSSHGGVAPVGLFGLFAYQFQSAHCYCEQNVWGTRPGNNFISRIEAVKRALDYRERPTDTRIELGKATTVTTGETIWSPGRLTLLAEDAGVAVPSLGKVTHTITDPPLWGTLNYAELSDFFYVWLRIALADSEPAFRPSLSPKEAELVENVPRGKPATVYENDLCNVLRQCAERMDADGLLVLTFHHVAGDLWETFLRLLGEGGYVCVAIYPLHTEREHLLTFVERRGIASDLIHVCRKREEADTNATDSRFVDVRREIQQQARREFAKIEAGRYGSEPLSPADVNLIVIGKCLSPYMRNWDRVANFSGRRVSLHDALGYIRLEADQLLNPDRSLPLELEGMDPVSYVCLLGFPDWSDPMTASEVDAYSRGIADANTLQVAGVLRKEGKSYRAQLPADRLRALLDRYEAHAVDGPLLPGMDDGYFENGSPFIDCIHFLLAIAETGADTAPWVRRFRGVDRIRSACELVRHRQPAYAKACKAIIRSIERR